MSANTHLQIDPALCGEPLELEDGRAVVQLRLTQNMAVDERGLTHGGFTFGLADYAAMLAVNHPLVVLAKAEVRFTRPCVAGETLEAHAEVTSSDAPRHVVEVEVRRAAGPAVFKGTFHCVVPDAHVLDTVS